MPQLTTYIPNVTLLAEQTITNYISSSLYNGGMYNNGITNVSGSLIDPSTQFYTGVANTDVEGPAVLVVCNTAQETYFQTRVYRLNLDISTRMMAADSQTSPNVTSSAISFGGNVAALFAETNRTVQGINALTSSLAAIQVQVMDFRNERIEDAWISNCNVNIIASLVAG